MAPPMRRPSTGPYRRGWRQRSKRRTWCSTRPSSLRPPQRRPRPYPRRTHRPPRRRLLPDGFSTDEHQVGRALAAPRAYTPHFDPHWDRPLDAPSTGGYTEFGDRMDIEGLLKKLPETTSPADRELVAGAYKTAERAHAGQKRLSGEKYVQHCLAVADILAGLNAPPSVLAAGLLHDTVEDTSVRLEDIRRDFGQEVATLVDGVTKLDESPRASRGVSRTKAASQRAELAKETLRKTFLAMGDDVRVVVIKLADRVHNMLTLSYLPAEKRQRIALETLEIFAPLANRLGIWQMKWELEDF